MNELFWFVIGFLLCAMIASIIYDNGGIKQCFGM